MAAIRISRARLKASLSRGFGIQYWGQSFNTLELSRAPHGLLVLEASRVGASSDAREVLFDAEEVAELTRNGTRTIIGYLNVTEIENYRDYWVKACLGAAAPDVPQTEPWFGPRTPAGEQLAIFWDPSWERILTDRIERMISLGFQGIFLDDVLHYFTYLAGADLDWSTNRLVTAPQGYATAMMELVQRLSRFARSLRPDAVIIVNNGVFLAEDAGDEIGVDRAEALFTGYASEIDGILVESAFGPSAVASLRRVLSRRYLNRGICVLTVDFAKQFPDRPTSLARWIVDYRASREGYVSYLADDDSFDRLYPPFSRRISDLE